MPTSKGESAAHFRLKRMALLWAQEQGYPIAGAEVSLPNFRFRLDAAAYRPGWKTSARLDARTQRERKVTSPAIGITAIFECKVSRADYLRDSRSAGAIAERLRTLAARRATQEEMLRLHYPSIRNGDSLFPEYETLNFGNSGCEAYLALLEEMRRLSVRLHANTKFERLLQWRAANLHYLVTEPELFSPHETPAGWGVLLRIGETLQEAARPHFHEVEEAQRLQLLHRIAMAGSRAMRKAHGAPEETEGSREPE